MQPMHAVGQEMARANALPAMFLALPGADGSAGNLADDSREDHVALKLDAALL
jgi:hypothetical protein